MDKNSLMNFLLKFNETNKVEAVKDEETVLDASVNFVEDQYEKDGQEIEKD